MEDQGNITGSEDQDRARGSEGQIKTGVSEDRGRPGVSEDPGGDKVIEGPGAAKSPEVHSGVRESMEPSGARGVKDHGGAVGAVSHGVDRSKGQGEQATQEDKDKASNWADPAEGAEPENHIKPAEGVASGHVHAPGRKSPQAEGLWWALAMALGPWRV